MSLSFSDSLFHGTEESESENILDSSDLAYKLRFKQLFVSIDFYCFFITLYTDKYKLVGRDRKDPDLHLWIPDQVRNDV